MLSNFVHPGDWWLFIVTGIGIAACLKPLLARIGIVIIGGTTAYIGHHYGGGRAILHVVLSAILYWTLIWAIKTIDR